MKSYNVYICGVGGQGIIKTSIVIGEAAMKTNLGVVMSEIHGMAQRGGVVSTEIKLGDSRSPIIEGGDADILIAFEPMEALRAVSKTSKETYIIVNTSPIMPFNIQGSEVPYPKVDSVLDELRSKVKQVYAMDAEKMAKDAGHVLSLNMVMIGGASAVGGFPISKEVIIESMKANLPKKSIPINMNAFEQGFEFVSFK
ncbi:indolepyruvate oxidoreductase subunit beta [Methanobacterium sp. ACI-7]|uniref:indolepyruvate oxidoreductase subunit beta n=1 Tax=unclassified Methanobacterium TaxID=2627676 RepID=UPI0039C136F8